MLYTLREHQLYAKYNKCEFYNEQIEYLGHTITKEGIVIDLEKNKTIMECHVPKNVADICSFLGLDGYYRRFIEGISKVANPLSSLQRKGKVFKWTKEC